MAASKRSPLEGLRQAVERGQVDLKPMPAEQKERVGLVRECQRLAEVLHDTYKAWDVRVSEHADGSFSCYAYDCRDERYVSLFPDGRVAVTTWHTSGHNGDPYGEETRQLDPVAAKQELVRLRDSLQAQAVDAERKLQKQLAEQREHAALLKNVRARLKNI